MSDKKAIVLECVGSRRDIIKIKFIRDVSPLKSVAYLTAAFNKCFERGFYRIIIDMGNINFQHNNFIAVIIEATSKARRENGDIKLINVSEGTRQIIAGFSAYSYLAIESIE